MTIKYVWSGMRAIRLGLLVLIGADIYYLFPDVAICIVGLIAVLTGFTRV